MACHGTYASQEGANSFAPFATEVYEGGTWSCTAENDSIYNSLEDLYITLW